mgnify:CR=1 FL=1
MDLRLNSGFDTGLDDRNDLAVVTGREAFEQNIAVRMTDFFIEQVGSLDHPNAFELLDLQATRIVREMDELESVVQVLITKSPDKPNTADVTVIYQSSPDFAFEISE